MDVEPGGVRGVRGLLDDKVVCRPELWGDGSVCIVIFAYQYAWQRPACQEFVLQFFCHCFCHFLSLSSYIPYQVLL